MMDISLSPLFSLCIGKKIIPEWNILNMQGVSKFAADRLPTLAQ
jgi:hypothetical protein